MQIPTQTKRQSGSIVVTIIYVMLFLSTILFGLIILGNASLIRAYQRIYLLQAQYSAESGADAALATINGGNAAYTGTTSDVQVVSNSRYRSTYATVVSAGSSGKEEIITATGKLYQPAAATTPMITRQIRVTIQRTSTSTASSILSRNILEIDSGVKNIIGKDIYVSGYIHMNKNTTNLIAENITVAGKNTGATNCSIGGTGNLLKPATFTNPGQTKTKLTLAYNNCITPPGNTSNANFDVLANQTNVSTLQSMYIPWSQYMDSSYTNAGNCNDWTTGASPRNIPSTAGSKKTHYPDSNINVASSCGTSGDIALGSNQYNITDNVHIRANFCAASACTPKFYNPTANTYFVFIEGTVNFGALTSVSGSGPIVIITYGSDPASKTGVCPYGGATYLGNSGNTSAPAIYLLATNGICLDKTKFSSNPALGGVGGKNIYVATNPGTPFDLKMDTNFPVSQIPIDLYWRAVGYERL